MSGDFDPSNPYSSPDPSRSSPYSGDDQQQLAAAKSRLMPPAIFLLVVGGLGIVLSMVGIVNALVAKPPPVDPNLPEFIRDMQQHSVGPVAAATQGIFLMVNAAIIFGAVQMLRIRSWALALAASILAMVNFGSCCCVLGLPAGIWSIIVLANQSVKDAFLLASQSNRSPW